MERYQLILISDIGAIVLLLVLFIGVSTINKRKTLPQYQIFCRAIFVNLFTAAAGCGYVLAGPESSGATKIVSLAFYVLLFIGVELWFFFVTIYLLRAAEKADLAGKLQPWLLLIVLLVSAAGIICMITRSIQRGPEGIGILPAVVFCISPAVDGIVCLAALWKRDRGLLSVILFMAIIYFYIANILETTFALSACLAVTLVFAPLCVRNHKKLFQVGSVLLLLIVGVGLLASSYIMSGVASFYLRQARETDQKCLLLFETDLEGYQAYPWMLRYWADHPETVRKGIEEVKKTGSFELYNALNDIIYKYDIESIYSVTTANLEQFSGEEQQVYGIATYGYVMYDFLYDARSFGMDELTLIYTDDKGVQRVLFDADTNPDSMQKLGEEAEVDVLRQSQENYNRVVRSSFIEMNWLQMSDQDTFGYSVDYRPPVSPFDMRFCLFVSYGELSKKLEFVGAIKRQLIFILTLLAVATLFVMYRTILRPMSRITKAVRDYEQDKDAGRTGEQLKSIQSGNEIGILAREFTSLTKEMDRYTKEAARMAGERERAETELRMAAQIQESALPLTFPAFPDRTEFDLYARMRPARVVGGDFYDFFLIDEDHLAMVIADVSDKGIPAALFMMSSKNLINYRAKQGGTPGEIITEVNRQICGDGPPEMFVTVWMGILNLTNGKLICTNAGHANPVLRWQNGSFHVLHDRHGLVVGGLRTAVYEDYEVQLEPDDIVFVYTDGISESNNTSGELYGMERLERALNRTGDLTVKEIVFAVEADVDRFAEGAAQFDDMTMLCMKYIGSGTEMKSAQGLI